MRHLLSCLFACLFASLFIAGTAQAGGTISDLTITLAAEKAAIVGEQDITIRLKISNKTGETIAVPQPQLPRSGIPTPLFSVTTTEGKAVEYIGPLIKWSPQALKDTVKFAPGASREYVVDLSRSYAFGNGTYTIAYVGSGLQALSKRKLSESVTITIQGWKKSDLVPAPRALPEPSVNILTQAPTQTRAQTYLSCTAPQKTAISAGASNALLYAKRGATYFALRTPATASPRYRTWFGYPATIYWNAAKSHFLKIYRALVYQTLNFDCSCTEAGVFAYVYPNQPYKIYLCQAFWSAPTIGTDSKAGTIIHEMSHFSILGGTQDYVYGQTAAKALARTSPNRAVNNADNHEYFAENTPFLP